MAHISKKDSTLESGVGSGCWGSLGPPGIGGYCSRKKWRTLHIKSTLNFQNHQIYLFPVPSRLSPCRMITPICLVPSKAGTRAGKVFWWKRRREDRRQQLRPSVTSRLHPQRRWPEGGWWVGGRRLRTGKKLKGTEAMTGSRVQLVPRKLSSSTTECESTRWHAAPPNVFSLHTDLTPVASQTLMWYPWRRLTDPTSSCTPQPMAL